MKINGKLTKEQIDKYILEKYNSLIKTFIISMIMISLIFVPITLGLDNKTAFFAIVVFLLVLIVLFIFLVKLLKKWKKNQIISNNKNYTYEFTDNSFIAKQALDAKEYPYDKIGLIVMKSFLVVDTDKKNLYIISMDNLEKNDIKEIKKHFI